MPDVQLGDAVHAALDRAGVTEARVARWLGGSCGGCRERREKLNALSAWAKRAARGTAEQARDWFRRLTDV